MRAMRRNCNRCGMLSPAERAMPELALRAAQRMLALGGDHAVVRRWLRPVASAWSSRTCSADRVRMALEAGMVAVGDASDQEWLARIELASQTHPRDAGAAIPGRYGVCAPPRWGRAQVLLTQALRGLDDATLRRQAWRALPKWPNTVAMRRPPRKPWKQSARKQRCSRCRKTGGSAPAGQRSAFSTAWMVLTSSLHGPRHGTHAAGHGRDPAGELAHAFKSIAAEAPASSRSCPRR